MPTYVPIPENAGRTGRTRRPYVDAVKAAPKGEATRFTLDDGKCATLYNLGISIRRLCKIAGVAITTRTQSDGVYVWRKESAHVSA